jgi:acyl-CoA-binding protein
LIFVKERRGSEQEIHCILGVSKMMHDYLSKNGSHVSARVPSPGVASMMDAWIPTAAYFEAWNKAVYRAGDEVTQNWLKFVDSRLAKDSALSQQITACRNLGDVCNVYAKFWQQMAGDYTAEFSSIADTGWKAAQSFLDKADDGSSASKAN